MRDRQRDQTQRWLSILVGAAVIVVSGWMTVEAMDARPVKKVEADAGAPSASVAPEPPDAAVVVAEPSLDGGLFLPSLSLGDAAVLPGSAPRSVKIGVVLVAYQGAEGAAATARPKREALNLAERLVGEARADFHHAVTAGDSGSADDIGRIPRGVLDPRTELAVFALAPGDVSEILETPKGYWIVKRIE